MGGLVNYGSSDEEDVLKEEHEKDAFNVEEPTTLLKSNGFKSEANPISTTIRGPQTAPLPNPDAPLVGPSLAPARDIPAELQLPEVDETMAPTSPYSANRALLRDLTLPTVPNYDIPPSPPGSPMESTNSRFKHFLELKKRGVHFNEKLAKSSALKNPSLMQKLMDFSDIDEAGQYGATLAKDLWDPNSFPGYAYKEELAKSQQKILKRKDDEKSRGQRESLDFVPASSAGESSSRSGSLGIVGRPTQKSAAERVMAGLDKGRSSSPQVQGIKRKTRFES